MNNTIENIITFIIPTIGRDSLSIAIQSLLKQTNPNWKCILVFDGVQIQPEIDYIGGKYSLLEDTRFTLLRTKKLGNLNLTNLNLRIGGSAGLVRDEALKFCSTEWVGFLDDDDSLSQNYVELLYEKYHSYDLVVWRAIWHNGQILPPLGTDELNRGMVGIHFCYKKSIFPNILFNHNDGGEDFNFLKKILNSTNNYIVTNDIVYTVDG